MAPYGYPPPQGGYYPAPGYAEACPPPGQHGGFMGPMPMGAGGTCPPHGYDLMNDVGIEGPLVDQRGPHYFDLRAEAVFLSRDETFGRSIDFTSINVGNTIVLSTDDLDYGAEAGFRVMGRYDVGPLSVLEFGYMGVFDSESSAEFFDPTGNLFSLFSRPAPGQGQFGVNPVGVNLPGGPMPETERATFHRIAIESDLQSAEMSFRRYWVGYSPRVSGTLLAGFRYTKLNEDFEFNSIGSEPAIPGTLDPLGGLDYFVRTDNDLAGVQLGADVWIALSQGVRFGLEGKSGIFNNHYSLQSEIVTTPLGVTPPTLFEEIKHNKVAFISELSADLVFDVLPSWSVRVGYELLWLERVVLAGDNFNEVSPYGNQAPRIPFVDDEGSAIYHGGHFGVEFIY
jgi:hypothetical protein